MDMLRELNPAEMRGKETVNVEELIVKSPLIMTEVIYLCLFSRRQGEQIQNVLS
jgi:hypothetical protein